MKMWISIICLTETKVKQPWEGEGGPEWEAGLGSKSEWGSVDMEKN